MNIRNEIEALNKLKKSLYLEQKLKKRLVPTFNQSLKILGFIMNLESCITDRKLQDFELTEIKNNWRIKLNH
jgi:hypothetical protein